MAEVAGGVFEITLGFGLGGEILANGDLGNGGFHAVLRDAYSHGLIVRSIEVGKISGEGACDEFIVGRELRRGFSGRRLRKAGESSAQKKSESRR